MTQDKNTHFGFQTVAEAEKAKKEAEKQEKEIYENQDRTE